MPHVKVKLTDLNSGQDYLLLATNINAKGLLVESVRILAPGTPLALSLTLPDGREPLHVRGEVHRTAERPGGAKAMVIRFVDLSAAGMARIERFVLSSITKDHSATSSLGEKTSMVDLHTLSRLSLSSLEGEPITSTSTLDEEAIHNLEGGLGGATRIAAMPGPRSSSVPRKVTNRFPLRMATWIFGSVVVGGIVLMALARPVLMWLDRTFALKPPTEVIAVSGSPPAIASPSIPSQPPALREPAVPVGKISSIDVEKSDSFVKVIVRGEGNFREHSISQASSPKRFFVDFPKIQTSAVREVISAVANPLLRLRTTGRENGGTRVVLELYPLPQFPRYEVQAHDGSIDIFLIR